MNDYSISLSKFGFGALRQSTFLADPATDGLQHVCTNNRFACLLETKKATSFFTCLLPLAILASSQETHFAWLSARTKSFQSTCHQHASFTLYVRGSINVTMVQSLVVGPEVQLINRQHQVDGQRDRKCMATTGISLSLVVFFLSDP